MESIMYMCIFFFVRFHCKTCVCWKNVKSATIRIVMQPFHCAHLAEMEIQCVLSSCNDTLNRSMCSPLLNGLILLLSGGETFMRIRMATFSIDRTLYRFHTHLNRNFETIQLHQWNIKSNKWFGFPILLKLFIFSMENLWFVQKR